MSALAQMQMMMSTSGGPPPLSFISYVDSLTPVAHWRMNEAPGATALVDRIAGEAATLAGSFTLAQTGMIIGDSSTGILWNGSGSAVTSASSKWTLGTGDFSAFIVQKSTQSAFASNFSVRDGTALNVLMLFLYGLSAPTAAQYNGWSSNIFDAVGSVVDGSPHGIGVTYEQSTGATTLYVDGVSVATATQITSTRPTASTMSVNIGLNYTSQNMTGTQQDLILFDTLLTGAQMAGLAGYVS